MEFIFTYSVVRSHSSECLSIRELKCCYCESDRFALENRYVFGRLNIPLWNFSTWTEAFYSNGLWGRPDSLALKLDTTWKSVKTVSVEKSSQNINSRVIVIQSKMNNTIPVFQKLFPCPLLGTVLGAGRREILWLVCQQQL